MKKILFVCTGNSCRSQMAEGLAKNLGWDAFSAGTNPEKEVNPSAVKAMSEMGLDISQQCPKLVEEIDLNEMDVILTVCSNAEENCPVFPRFKGQKLHHSFDDPADAIGTEAEKLAVFCRVRDEIKDYLIKNL